MSQHIWLEPHERERIAAYLRQEADSEEQMAGVMGGFSHPVVEAIANHRRQTATVLRRAADYVAQWEPA